MNMEGIEKELIVKGFGYPKPLFLECFAIVRIIRLLLLQVLQLLLQQQVPAGV